MANNWIYEHQEEIQVRYVLGEQGNNPLICIGINPSTAEPDKLDRTLTRVRDVAQHNKYDGWIMLNVYPSRKTNPNDLSKSRDDKIAARNIKEIKKILTKYPNSDIWCAWGNIVEKRKYLKTSLKELLEIIPLNRKLLCICYTKKKHPKHPLYCKKDSQLINFDVEKYKQLHMESTLSAGAKF